MKILLFKLHMAMQTYLMIFLSIIEKLTSQSKCLQKRRFCEFISLDMNETIFRYPRVYSFQKSIMSADIIFWLGQFFSYSGHVLQNNEVNITLFGWRCPSNESMKQSIAYQWLKNINHPELIMLRFMKANSLPAEKFNVTCHLIIFINGMNIETSGKCKFVQVS